MVSTTHPHTQGLVLTVLHNIRVSIHPEDLLKVTEVHQVVPWVAFPVIWVVHHLKVDHKDRTVAHPMLELLVMVDHQEDSTVALQFHTASMDSPLVLLDLLDTQGLVDHNNMEEPHSVLHLMLDLHLSFLQEDQLVRVDLVHQVDLNHHSINRLVSWTLYSENTSIL